jgi:hypothetical protein
MSENMICTQIEGQLRDINYGACFTAEELSLVDSNAPGFSSGKFIIYGQQLYSDLLDIITYIFTKNTIYYCHDQTFYNKALYVMDKEKYHVSMIDSSLLSANGHNYTENTILLDVMGVPGDGPLHFDKMLMFYLLLQSDLLDVTILKPKA